MFGNDDEEGVAIDLDALDEAAVTEEDVLMFSTYAGPRVFLLTDAKRTNLLGLVLDENDDSFLVGLPAKIIEKSDGPAKVVPFVPVPYFRLMKSATMSVMYVPSPVDALYEEYVDTTGREIYPEVAEYIEAADVEQEPIETTTSTAVPKAQEVSLTPDAKDGNKVQGMTDEELRQYLTEKYNNGELSSGSRKKQ